MDTSSYRFFDVSVEDHIATAVFNGDDPLNRWALADEHELFALPDDVAADDDIHVLVLTGAGDAFAGGAHHSDDPFDASSYYFRSCTLFRKYLELDKPIVVAVNGAISGSGLSLALLADIVVAERHVTFADPHVLIGVVSATGSYEWPPNIGLARARRYLLTGDQFSAEEARDMGLIAEVVDTGGSLARAMEHARKIASLRPLGVQATKRALLRDMRSNFAPVFEHGLALEFLTFPQGLY
ncbi:MAG: enoyl-CoA hydratase/isomerase family protein [Ilumatobacteraceae bacterium]